MTTITRGPTRILRTVAFYAALTAGLLVFLLPVLWMVSASFMRRQDVLSAPVKLLPPIWRFANYREIFVDFNLGHYFLNSVFVTGSVVVLNVLFCSMVGYSLAKFDFPGKNLVFGFILSTIMVPFTAILIPLYLIVREFHWINTYQALIVPAAFTAFGTFLLRQFFLTIPRELEEAARIDGCSYFGVYRRIILPLSGPALATLGVFSFMGAWNAFLWPLVMISDKDMRTLTVALRSFQTEYGTEWTYLMAGSTIALIPILVLYVIAQKYFVRGIALTGLGGR